MFCRTGIMVRKLKFHEQKLLFWWTVTVTVTVMISRTLNQALTRSNKCKYLS